MQDTQSQDKSEDTKKFIPLLVAELKAAQAQRYPITKEFLVADGLGDIFAGTDTTSTTLTMTIRAIFKDHAIYTRLHEELKTVLPTHMTIPTLVELEKLPFLSACVKVCDYNLPAALHYIKAQNLKLICLLFRRAYDIAPQYAPGFHESAHHPGGCITSTLSLLALLFPPAPI